MTPSPRQIGKSAAPDRSRAIERLERLVSFNTENPPGREIEAIDYLAQLFRDMGWPVEVTPIASGRANIVATLRNGDGPVIAFNSHVDVSPRAAAGLPIRSS